MKTRKNRIMKINNIIKRLSIMTALALSASVFAAESRAQISDENDIDIDAPISKSVSAAESLAPVSLTPAGKQLEEQYSKMLADLKEAIKALEPKVDEGKKAEFTKRVAALGDVPPVTKTVADSNFVKELKGGSSSWINSNNIIPGRFKWQAGYGWFSVSPKDTDQVVAYIQNQAEHHKKITFQEEYRRFLNLYNIEYDERYVWD